MLPLRCIWFSLDNVMCILLIRPLQGQRYNTKGSLKIWYYLFILLISQFLGCPCERRGAVWEYFAIKTSCLPKWVRFVLSIFISLFIIFYIYTIVLPLKFNPVYIRSHLNLRHHQLLTAWQAIFLNYSYYLFILLSSVCLCFCSKKELGVVAGLLFHVFCFPYPNLKP